MDNEKSNPINHDSIRLARDAAKNLARTGSTLISQAILDCVDRLEHIESNQVSETSVLFFRQKIESLERDKGDLARELESLRADNAVLRAELDGMRGRGDHWAAKAEHFRNLLKPFMDEPFLQFMSVFGYNERDPIDFREAYERARALHEAAMTNGPKRPDTDLEGFIVELCHAMGFETGVYVSKLDICSRLHDIIVRRDVLERFVASIAEALGFPPNGISRRTMHAMIVVMKEQFLNLSMVFEDIRETLGIPGDELMFDKIKSSVVDLIAECEKLKTAVSSLAMERDDLRDTIERARQTVEGGNGEVAASLLTRVVELQAVIRRQYDAYRDNQKTMTDRTADLERRIKDTEDHSKASCHVADNLKKALAQAADENARLKRNAGGTNVDFHTFMRRMTEGHN